MEQVAVQILPILLAVVLHEVAHGWAADKLGDDTARRLGRLSLNPVKHVDPVGTVLVPLLQILTAGRVFFGWAKPVPVNPAQFRDPRRGMLWVAIAGPATNIALAVIAGILMHIMVYFVPELPYLATQKPATPAMMLLVPIWLMCLYSILINSALAGFNMIPIPPLDGSRVLMGILPIQYARQYARLEAYGMFIVVGVIFFLPGVTSFFMGQVWRVVATLVRVDPAWLVAL